MSSSDDNRRRDRIARAARDRDEAGTTPVRQVRTTYWVTRDRWPDGTLADYVRVWLRQPNRDVHDDGHRYWLARRDAARGDYTSALYVEWDLKTCERELGTTPDDERQCIRRDCAGGLAVFPKAQA